MCTSWLFTTPTTSRPFVWYVCIWYLQSTGAKWSRRRQKWEGHSGDRVGQSGTDAELRKMPGEGKKKSLLAVMCSWSCERRCTTEVGTGFSSSLIPISSLLHYSFKAGVEEKQREGADYKKGGSRQTGTGGEAKGKSPRIKRSQRERVLNQLSVLGQ